MGDLPAENQPKRAEELCDCPHSVSGSCAGHCISYVSWPLSKVGVHAEDDQYVLVIDYLSYAIAWLQEYQKGWVHYLHTFCCENHKLAKSSLFPVSLESDWEAGMA